MGGVEVPQAPRWRGVGRGYNTGGRVWGEGGARKFVVFFLENTIF